MEERRARPSGGSARLAGRRCLAPEGRPRRKQGRQGRRCRSWGLDRTRTQGWPVRFLNVFRSVRSLPPVLSCLFLFLVLAVALVPRLFFQHSSFSLLGRARRATRDTVWSVRHQPRDERAGSVVPSTSWDCSWARTAGVHARDAHSNNNQKRHRPPTTNMSSSRPLPRPRPPGRAGVSSPSSSRRSSGRHRRGRQRRDHALDRGVGSRVDCFGRGDHGGLVGRGGGGGGAGGAGEGGLLGCERGLGGLGGGHSGSLGLGLGLAVVVAVVVVATSGLGSGVPPSSRDSCAGPASAPTSGTTSTPTAPSSTRATSPPSPTSSPTPSTTPSITSSPLPLAMGLTEPGRPGEALVAGEAGVDEVAQGEGWRRKEGGQGEGRRVRGTSAASRKTKEGEIQVLQWTYFDRGTAPRPA